MTNSISRFIIPAMFVAVFCAFGSTYAHAAGPFDTDIRSGMRGDQVTMLQAFLGSQGYFKASSTPIFGPATKAAVERFQRAHSIPATGTVGPLTRAAMNAIALAPLQGATLAMVDPVSGTLAVGDKQDVTWASTNYDAKTVKVNLIRKVASHPDRYELVRTIATSTANDGLAVWVPSPKDIGSGLTIEVACAGTSQSCRAATPVTSNLAVKDDGRWQNTASAYQAIEDLYNAK